MSMTTEATLKARTQEMFNAREVGSEMWVRLNSPQTLVAERRELRTQVEDQRRLVEELSDEIKDLTNRYLEERSVTVARAAEQPTAPPVNDPKAVGILYTRGLNGLVWTMVSTQNYLAKLTDRLEDAKGRGQLSDQKGESNPDGGMSTGYETLQERIDAAAQQLDNMRVLHAWAKPEALAAINGCDPMDDYAPKLETEHSVRARKAAGNSAATPANPFSL